MSRIGKQPIALPPKVKVEVKGQKVHVEGPKGKLDWELPARTSVKVTDGRVEVARAGDDAQAKATSTRPSVTLTLVRAGSSQSSFPFGPST